MYLVAGFAQKTANRVFSILRQQGPAVLPLPREGGPSLRRTIVPALQALV